MSNDTDVEGATIEERLAWALRLLRHARAERDEARAERDALAPSGCCDNPQRAESGGSDWISRSSGD